LLKLAFTLTIIGAFGAGLQVALAIVWICSCAFGDPGPTQDIHRGI
jgi:hypothetical protein